MIVEMGKWCLKTACIQAKEWVKMGAYDIRIAVNVSAIEFSDDGFKNNVVRALKDAELDSSHLEIELTETTIMEDAESAQRIINELRYLGVTVSLDDFGTGYSSLSYFGKLEMDWLKLDRSFLLEAMENERSTIMYTSIVRMAHETGVNVISEGVETEDQLDYIESLNIDVLQGYILSKPLCATDAMNLLFPAYYEDISQHSNIVC